MHGSKNQIYIFSDLLQPCAIGFEQLSDLFQHFTTALISLSIVSFFSALVVISVLTYFIFLPFNLNNLPTCFSFVPLFSRKCQSYFGIFPLVFSCCSTDFSTLPRFSSVISFIIFALVFISTFYLWLSFSTFR